MTDKQEATIRFAATSTKKECSPYDAAFQQHLINYGIFPPNYRYADQTFPPTPRNLEEIRNEARKPRKSLDMNADGLRGLFDQVRVAISNISGELKTHTALISKLQSSTEDPKSSAGGLKLTNYLPLTDNTLTPSNPDYYYGARAEQLHTELQTTLSRLLVPRHDSPVLPNFFLAIKAAHGDASVAMRQACYDGTFGARAMHISESLLKERRYWSGNAETISCTFIDGTLKMFACLPFESKHQERPTHYAMTMVDAYNLDATAERCKEGIAAFRNLARWALERRTKRIGDLNTAKSISQDALDRLMAPEQAEDSRSARKTTSLCKSSRLSTQDDSSAKRNRTSEHAQRRYGLRPR